VSGGAGLLGELKVATEGSSASPFIGRRSGNSSQLQPPPLMTDWRQLWPGVGLWASPSGAVVLRRRHGVRGKAAGLQR